MPYYSVTVLNVLFFFFFSPLSLSCYIHLFPYFVLTKSSGISIMWCELFHCISPVSILSRETGHALTIFVCCLISFVAWTTGHSRNLTKKATSFGLSTENYGSLAVELKLRICVDTAQLCWPYSHAAYRQPVFIKAAHPSSQRTTNMLAVGDIYMKA
jgi:hypothetical protein